MIKHVSFDFWDTLYVGNPAFRKERTHYLVDEYGVTPEQVQESVNRTKELCDGTSEQTMCNIDTTTQAWHLLNNLGYASPQRARDLAHFTYLNFLRNPPTPVFNSEQILDLRRKGISVSISCNTGLISGDSILEMLKKTGVYDVFDYTLFSDHIGYFKPSPFFMEKVFLNQFCNATTIKEVLHVGDNEYTDGHLCGLTGANFLLVKKGELNFDEINNLI